MGSWHAENITSRIQDLEVGGVFDISQTALARAKEKGFKAYNTFEELMTSDVDLVLVSVPNNFHKYYSVKALDCGKNVVCEKPVCMNSAELQEVIEAQKRSGKLFTVHQNRRFDDDFRVVKKILDEKIIGKPYFIDSRLFGEKGMPGDWRSIKEAGGGMIYDWGVHLIDQALQLDDSKVVSVYCDSKKVFYKDVDDCNKIVLTFESGLSIHIVVDTWCYLHEARWHVSANDGTCAIYGWPEYTGSIVKANIKEVEWEEGIIFTSAGRTRTMAPRPKEHLTTLELPILTDKEKPRWEDYYENVIDVLDGKAKPIVTIEQQVRLMQVMDACFESTKNKSVVKL